MQALDSPLRKVGVNARARLKNRGLVRNLLRRLAKPAFHNGTVQRGAMRALIALGGEASTSEAIEWTHPYGGKRECCRAAAYRALQQIEVPIGRAKTIGRPVIWRLEYELEYGQECKRTK